MAYVIEGWRITDRSCARGLPDEVRDDDRWHDLDPMCGVGPVIWGHRLATANSDSSPFAVEISELKSPKWPEPSWSSGATWGLWFCWSVS
jgi:hypothetical protein